MQNLNPVKTKQPVDFDENMPLYRVCCWHVKQWAYFIFVYDIVMTTVVFGIFIGAVIGVAMVLFLYKGIKEERKNYILPYLVIYWILLSIEAIIIIALLFIYFYFAIAYDDSSARINHPLIVAMIVIGITNVAFRLWLQMILHKTYGYLNDKQCHNLAAIVGTPIPISTRIPRVTVLSTQA